MIEYDNSTHDKYWTFEAIMTPSYLVFALIVLYVYFRRYQITDDWQRASLIRGVVIMIVQFVMDVIVIVGIFQNDFGYFIGLATLTYFTIPLWTYLMGKYTYSF